jgi:hypothetical protein
MTARHPNFLAWLSLALSACAAPPPGDNGTRSTDTVFESGTPKAFPSGAPMAPTGPGATRCGTPVNPQAHLTLNGGAVIQQPVVWNVHWGAVTDAGVMDVAVHSMLSGPWVSNLLNGTSADLWGSYAGSVSVASAPPNPVTDGAIQALIDSLIRDGSLPENDGHQLFVVFLPRGVIVGDDPKNHSCTNYCGYHSQFKITSPSPDRNSPNRWYAVIPDCEKGCADETQGREMVASHEMAEAITDPAPGAGWVDNSDYFAWDGSEVHGAENGDLCAWQGVQLQDGTWTQCIWSNFYDSCVAMDNPQPPLPPSCGVFPPNTGLGTDQSQVSCNGTFKLIMQGDGNLVLYKDGGTPVWASNTVGHVGAYAIMQGDGNLVVYDSAGKPLWASGTNGHPGAFASVESGGNVAVYDGFFSDQRLQLWTSNQPETLVWPVTLCSDDSSSCGGDNGCCSGRCVAGTCEPLDWCGGKGQACTRGYECCGFTNGSGPYDVGCVQGKCQTFGAR